MSESSRELTIDVVSDVICPWCFIGVRRLEQALQSVQGSVDAKLAFHPFLLDPTTPAGGADLRERLRAKYGMDPEKMFSRVEAAARESGIPLDFAKVRRTPPTAPAHTLIEHAAEKGTQQGLADALFGAYFLEGRDLGDADELSEIAVRHGFEASEARRLVTDPAELARTRDEAKAAAAQGITAVPFFVFAGQWAVSGAQPVDVFREAIRKATEHGHGHGRERGQV